MAHIFFADAIESRQQARDRGVIRGDSGRGTVHEIERDISDITEDSRETNCFTGCPWARGSAKGKLCVILRQFSVRFVRHCSQLHVV